MLDVLGDGDQADDILSEMYETDMNRMMDTETEPTSVEEIEVVEA
jgi:hypothetical protein